MSLLVLFLFYYICYMRNDVKFVSNTTNLSLCFILQRFWFNLFSIVMLYSNFELVNMLRTKQNSKHKMED